MTTRLLARLALVVAAVACALTESERRRNLARTGVINRNTEALLDILSAQESRINKAETFVYSGSAIDQRARDG